MTQANQQPQAVNDTVETEIAARLTIKDLGIDSRKVLKLIPEGQSKIAIARMYGIASKVGIQENRETGATYTFFVGSFEGVNLLEGDTMQSSKMFLPDGAQQVLEHALNQAQQRHGKNASVHFAFEIRLVTKDVSEVRAGYSYETAAILKAEHTDQLTAVRRYVDEATKAQREKQEAAKAEAAKTAPAPKAQERKSA